jgi:hypothetical protein
VRPARVRLQIAVDLDFEARAEHQPAQPLDLGAERFDVARPGGVAVPVITERSN